MKRPPTKEEIIDNLVNGDIDLYIDEAMIDEFLNIITNPLTVNTSL